MGWRWRRRRVRQRRRRTVAVVGAGVLGGGALLGAAGSAIADGITTDDRDPARLITATHLPPLLTAPGEQVRLRYDIYCPPPGPDPESGAPCDADGTVYVRPGAADTFRPIELRLDPAATEGRFVADLPPDVRTHEFAYYAVVRSRTSGATATLPAGGAAAPIRVRPLGRSVPVALGFHVFGAPRRAGARVAFARWGTGPVDVGLEAGPHLQPTGGSSFAVDASGVVSLLDEANHRVLRFRPDGTAPAAMAVDVRGTIADLAIAADGRMIVLETVGGGDASPLVRTFDADGRARGAQPLAERTAGALRTTPEGAAALTYPSGQWLPVSEHGAAVGPAQQRLRGRSGRIVRGGDELVAEREGNEMRVALIGPGGVRRSWRVTSDAALAEIQLAEPFGNGVLVVVRVYTDATDEFEVLALGANGLEQRFSVPSQAWAESAPLARFRLHGNSLFELGSTPDGVFVDRFDLEESP